MISIIVPVYNSETTLSRCIDSILNQTSQDFELILINDGSSDHSRLICEMYSRDDNRVRVFHKENGGVSSARNVGLENVKGDWVTFVDSDDWISDKYVENLANCISDSTELVISFAHMVNHPNSDAFSFPDCVIDSRGVDVLFSEFELRWRTSPWGKLYKLSTITDNNIKFVEEMHIGEDAHFLYNYIACCRGQIRLSSRKDYFYQYDNSGSLTKRINSILSEYKSYENIKDIIERLITVKKISDKKALKELNKLNASYVNRVLNSLYYNDTRSVDRIDVIRRLDIKQYLEFYLDNSLSLYRRILHALLKAEFYRLYDFVRACVKIYKTKRR